jgi:hypothetical protein
MRVTREARAALEAKYREMLRLRAAVEGGDAQRDRDSDDEAAARRALAARFPGALRELDELPTEEIRARVAALASDVEPEWAFAVWRYHELTRAALAAKRWLAGARNASANANAGEPPDDALLFRDDLARIARPPHGRLSVLVFERLARELSLTPAEARARVFPYSRRGGRFR